MGSDRYAVFGDSNLCLCEGCSVVGAFTTLTWCLGASHLEVGGYTFLSLHAPSVQRR